MTQAEHFQQLAKSNRIKVESHSRGGRAFRKKRLVMVRPVKSSVTYAIALHEIGHVLGPMQTGTRLEKEAGAWLWAKDNAVGWDDACERKMKESLASYHRWATRKHARGVRNAPRWPAPGHAFWALSGLSEVSLGH